ncbi:olfactory receptor 14I1-like [Ictidomys tridecemlineatus]|uniref:olfactory receptor 14I1-like n=1 Tax=Ictidomys tridecemlineatus TaxID=43179 RepID=UPI00038BDD6C|nr:olfactory receptor 14I1-like [Ictidomys tridecemlineatus]KAG3265174.1 olfactory receptor 14I1-like [Ictidomys tridecemlineatus]
MSIQTRVTHFILRGFSDIPEWRPVVIVSFLLVYAFGLLGNMSIITAVLRDSHLHTPMYFFLKNLCFLDLSYTSVTIPKALATTLQGPGVISYLECLAQLYMFFTLASAECFLLTAMAYDRCVAIYRPLLYGTIMSHGRCWALVVLAWVGGTLYSAFHTVNTFSVLFCGPKVVEHFFCDIPALMRLSCAIFHPREEVGFAMSSCIVLSSFALKVLSYIRILSTLLRMPSGDGRWKALSTCSSHLITVLLFYRSGSFTCLRSASQYSPIQGCLASVFYFILTPSLNLVIYSLRNRDMKVALQRLSCQRSLSAGCCTAGLGPGV